MDNINIAVFDNYLRGAHFPAVKEEIIREAQRKDAPAEILALLGKAPDREYRTENDLKKVLNDYILRQKETGPR